MTRKRKRKTADDLRAEGRLPTEEFLATLKQKGILIVRNERDLRSLRTTGLIDSPVRAGLDKLKRSVSWYSRKSMRQIEALNQMRIPPLADLPAPYFRSAWAAGERWVNEQSLQEVADLLLAVVSAQEEAKKTIERITAEVRADLEKRLAEEMQHPDPDPVRLELIDEILSGLQKPLTFLSGQIEKADLVRYALEHNVTEVLMDEWERWEHPAVGMAVYALNCLDDIQNVWISGHDEAAFEMMARIKKFVSFTREALERSFLLGHSASAPESAQDVSRPAAEETTAQKG